MQTFMHSLAGWSNHSEPPKRVFLSNSSEITDLDGANQIPVQSSTLERLIQKCPGLLILHLVEKKGIKDSEQTLAVNVS